MAPDHGGGAWLADSQNTISAKRPAPGLGAGGAGHVRRWTWHVVLRIAWSFLFRTKMIPAVCRPAHQSRFPCTTEQSTGAVASRPRVTHSYNNQCLHNSSQVGGCTVCRSPIRYVVLGHAASKSPHHQNRRLSPVATPSWAVGAPDFVLALGLSLLDRHARRVEAVLPPQRRMMLQPTCARSDQGALYTNETPGCATHSSCRSSCRHSYVQLSCRGVTFKCCKTGVARLHRPRFPCGPGLSPFEKFYPAMELAGVVSRRWPSPVALFNSMQIIGGRVFSCFLSSYCLPPDICTYVGSVVDHHYIPITLFSSDPLNSIPRHPQQDLLQYSFEALVPRISGKTPYSCSRWVSDS
jgi:hypothetical protein